MAAIPRYSLYWEETDCMSYYEMLSLHEVFEIVGSQLTDSDVEVLSFLLDEMYPARHPLDPEGWTENGAPDPDVPPNALCPRLLDAWQRIRPQGNQRPLSSRFKLKSGVGLLLEMERRGFLHEGNLENLLQLLRILTRHDLLPFVSNKKRRTVSPERKPVNYEESSENNYTNSHTDLVSQWKSGGAVPASVPARKRKGRGRGRSRKSRNIPEVLPQPAPNKVTCDGITGMLPQDC